MASVTLTISDDIKAELKRFSWINWSEVARESFLKKLKRNEAFKRFDEILRSSEFTEEDVLRLSAKVKEDRLKQLKRQGLI